MEANFGGEFKYGGDFFNGRGCFSHVKEKTC
jgi:hypothetical protein